MDVVERARALDILEFWHRIEYFRPFDLDEIVEDADQGVAASSEPDPALDPPAHLVVDLPTNDIMFNTPSHTDQISSIGDLYNSLCECFIFGSRSRPAMGIGQNGAKTRRI